MYMLHEVSKVLNKHQEVWEGEARIVTLRQLYGEKVERLNNLHVQKDELSRPFKEVREDLMDEFASRIVQLAGFLHELYAESGDKSMTMYTDVTKSDLIHSSIQNALTKAKAILDLAESMETELTNFTSGVDVLQSAVAQYQEFSENGLMPYDRRNRLRNLNLELRDANQDIKDFLKDRLDRVLLLFMDSDPQFYEEYKSARVIPNIPATRGSGEDTDDGTSDDPASADGGETANNSSPPDASGEDDDGVFDINEDAA